MEKWGAIDELVAFFYDSLSGMMSQAEEFFGLQQGVYNSCKVWADEIICRIASDATDCLNPSRGHCRQFSSSPRRSQILFGSGKGLPRWHPLAPLAGAINSCLPCFLTLCHRLGW